MRLIEPADVPEESIRRTFRHSSLPPAILFVVTCAVPGLLAWLASPDLRGLPTVVWVLGAPFALGAVALALLVLGTLAGAVRSCLLPSNWTAKVGPDGLYLSLRSHLNHHFGRGDRTVVQLAFDEVATARRVTERTEREGDRGPDVQRWLELITPGVDTEPLRAAVVAERGRAGPERSFLGVRTTGRSSHAPLIVPAPGVVRVEWLGRGMLDALAPHVAIAPSLRVVNGLVEPGAEEADRRFAELVERGQDLAAVELARRAHGESLTAAKARLDAARRGADGPLGRPTAARR